MVMFLMLNIVYAFLYLLEALLLNELYEFYIIISRISQDISLTTYLLLKVKKKIFK